MSADTYTNTIGVLLMGTGNDNNTWGTNANTAVFQIFEDAIANVLSSAVSGGTLDLSGSPPPNAASQARFAALAFTGTLTSNQTVKVPNLTKWWWVNNQTSGAFTLKIQATGAASTAIPQNSGWQLVQCDGNGNIIVAPFNSKQIQMPDGSVSLPAYSDINETNSGWYRHGAGDWRLSILGVDILQVTGSVVNVLTGTLEQGGTGVAVGTFAGISGTPTAGHLATWQSATKIQDGGAAGTLAGLNTVTSQVLDVSAQGMDMPLNCTISASVASNLLTVNLKTAGSATPSASSPVLINFPDATLANGDPANVSVTGALSISTNAVGATLGFVNNQSGRIWVAVFNNGGSAVLALINCSTSTSIKPLSPSGVASTTAISGSATSAGVFYTPNGTTLTNKAYRIIGFLSYETALVTAGTYNNAPDWARLYGPGMPLPGDVVQTSFATNTSSTSIGGTSATATGTTATITPTSKANLILARAIGVIVSSNGPATGVQIGRNSSSNLIGSAVCESNNTVSSGGIITPAVLEALDLPQANTAQTYTVYGYTPSGAITCTWLGTVNSFVTTGSMLLQELMG